MEPQLLCGKELRERYGFNALASLFLRFLVQTKCSHAEPVIIFLPSFHPSTLSYLISLNRSSAFKLSLSAPFRLPNSLSSGIIGGGGPCFTGIGGCTAPPFETWFSSMPLLNNVLFLLLPNHPLLLLRCREGVIDPSLLTVYGDPGRERWAGECESVDSLPLVPLGLPIAP